MVLYTKGLNPQTGVPGFEPRGLWAAIDSRLGTLVISTTVESYVLMVERDLETEPTLQTPCSQAATAPYVHSPGHPL